MSRNSMAVKTWRNKTKARIVESMGGCCYVCGYNKCLAAFDLHHIDPSTKSFSLGGIRANPRAWEQIVEELRKCILVCATCHREIEDEFIILESPKSTFNEQYVNYTLSRNVTLGKYKGQCHVCLIEILAKNKNQKYCSDVCRSIDFKKEYDEIRQKIARPKKVEWPARDVLSQKIQTMTWIAIAREYGVSDNAVRKWAKKYRLI